MLSQYQSSLEITELLFIGKYSNNNPLLNNQAIESIEHLYQERCYSTKLLEYNTIAYIILCEYIV